MKVKNPLFSFNAVGSIGGLLTFKSYLGGQVAHRKVTRSKSNTDPQAAERRKMKDASTAWRSLSNNEKLQWFQVAALTRVPVFAKYLLEWQAQESTLESKPEIPVR